MPTRIIIDTNLWVSYFLGKGMKARLDNIVREKWRLRGVNFLTGKIKGRRNFGEKI